MASDMALEIIGDFSIVWFLSPALSFSGRPGTRFARWTAALPGSSLQVRAAVQPSTIDETNCSAQGSALDNSRTPGRVGAVDIDYTSYVYSYVNIQLRAAVPQPCRASGGGLPTPWGRAALSLCPAWTPLKIEPFT